MSSSQDLILDRAVRDWVLIPLTASVMLLMLLRPYLSVVSPLARRRPRPPPPPAAAARRRPAAAAAHPPPPPSRSC